MLLTLLQLYVIESEFFVMLCFSGNTYVGSRTPDISREKPKVCVCVFIVYLCVLDIHTPSHPHTLTHHQVMFTGVVDEEGEETVRLLGGELVNTVYDCTHLVTDKVLTYYTPKQTSKQIALKIMTPVA